MTDPCPGDASDDGSESPETPALPSDELPPSLPEAIWYLASVQAQTNALLTQMIAQHQQILEALMSQPEGEETDEPHMYLDGTPIQGRG